MAKPDESVPLPPPPVEPELEDCCGSGCERCVFDVYQERLERWKRRCEALRRQASEPHRDNPS